MAVKIKKPDPASSMGSKSHHTVLIAFFLTFAVFSFPLVIAAADELPGQEEIERLAAGPALSDLINLALRANPSIASARQGWRANVEGYRVAGAYPDPKISASYPTETRIGDEEWQIALSQTVPLPGRLTAEENAASADIRIAHLTYEKAIRDLAAEVRQSAHELIYLQEAGKIAAGNRDLLNQLLASGTAAYARDRTSLIDLSRAAAQSGQLGYDAHLLAETAATEKTRLNGLLGRAPDAVVGPLIPPALHSVNHSLDDIYLFVEKNGSDILLARAALEKSEKNVTLARYKTLPEFDAGLFVNNINESDQPGGNGRTGVKAVGVTVSLSMPIWIGKNQGRMAEAKARVEQSRAEVQARTYEARAEVSRLFFRLRNAERLVRLYRDELIPQAAKSVETAETWFREGRGSLSDFTETRTVWYNFQLALARATADYGQNLAALEGLVGRTLTQSEAPSSTVPAAAQEENP
ncbi:MAG: hypothetical protein BM485_05785 [Desulfobulbaceae bacterium DB1]|nr:MAG: hypothetical protein BM485_05785 [Desulfobulbaceae bacterium DB1]